MSTHRVERESPPAGTGQVASRPRDDSSPWALTLCLLAVAASGAVMATGHWRKGSMAFACAVLMAGVLRLVLPRRRAGLLAVRSRVADCLVLLGLGAAMAALVLVVPHSR